MRAATALGLLAGAAADAESLGAALADELLGRGGRELLG